MSNENSSLKSMLHSEPATKQVNLDRLNSNRANYGDLLDAFARELSAEEILLVSGGAVQKAGGFYCGTAYA